METAAYKISHTTTYEYAEPVRICHNVVALTPREDGGVRCRRHQLVIRPTPTVSVRRIDCFGNVLNNFSIEEAHRRLRVTASSRVAVTQPVVPAPESTFAWEKLRVAALAVDDPRWLEACRYAFDSPRVRRDERFADYATAAFTPGRPIVAAALDLNRRIYQEFEYDVAATHAESTPEEAFAIKRGVCQDFAHVMLACLRSLGLAARYVSGYLRTNPPPGKPRLVGADQSHAWASLYCGPAGWVDFDPTNDVTRGLDHVPLAWGRDYSDVAPVRGVFLGGGAHQLKVSVDVAPVEG